MYEIYLLLEFLCDFFLRRVESRAWRSDSLDKTREDNATGVNRTGDKIRRGKERRLKFSPRL